MNKTSSITGSRTGLPDPIAALFVEAFEDLHARLCMLRHHRLAPEEAHDALQNAFLALARRHQRDGFWPARPGDWLVRVAANQARKLRAPRGAAPVEATLADPGQRRPISICVEVEQREVTREALGALDPETRRIVENHVILGRPFAAIAADLGLTEENTRKICRRGLREVHERLGRYSSSLVPQEDAATYRPRTRRGALSAIHTLPAAYAEALLDCRVSNLKPEEAAARRGLAIESVLYRLLRAEELLKRKYGLNPSELAELLRR